MKERQPQPSTVYAVYPAYSSPQHSQSHVLCGYLYIPTLTPEQGGKLREGRGAVLLSAVSRGLCGGRALDPGTTSTGA